MKLLILLALAACAAAAHNNPNVRTVSVGKLESVPRGMVRAQSANTHHKAILKRDLKDTMLKQLKNGKVPSSVFTVNRHKRHVLQKLSKLTHLPSLKGVLRDRRDLHWWDTMKQNPERPILHAEPQRIRRGAHLRVINRLKPVVHVQPLRNRRNTPAFVRSMLDMKN